MTAITTTGKFASSDITLFTSRHSMVICGDNIHIISCKCTINASIPEHEQNSHHGMQMYSKGPGKNLQGRHKHREVMEW